MSSNWKRVERETAAVLSEFYVKLGFTAVERIPILGREGPDLAINEARLVLDVKSRQEVPRSHCLEAGQLHLFPVPTSERPYVGVRLDSLDLLTKPHNLWPSPPISSIVVSRWLAHMDTWTQKFLPSGVSGLILHRPRVAYRHTTLIFYYHDFEKLRSNLCLQRTPLSP